MWGLLSDWLLLNTVLNGPEDTRRKVRAAGKAVGKVPGVAAGLLHLAAWITWWGLLVLVVVVGVSGAVQGRPDSLVVAALFIGVLVLARAAWRWFRRQLALADAASARARARAPARTAAQPWSEEGSPRPATW